MASFDFDQAEGLRRMLAGPKPRVITFLSAASGEEKNAMLVNLGASMAQGGRDVLLLDACLASEGVSTRMNVSRGSTLLQVARRERSLDDVMVSMPQGFSIAALKRNAQRLDMTGEQARGLHDAFDVLATRADIVVVDAELDKDDGFPISSLADGDIVVQVSNSPTSIKEAYAIIKRLNGKLGRRPFNLLVTGASEKEARVVYQNMAQVANRYLAVRINSVGSVPADEHTKRAMHLGRAVVDAFPLAGASVAFRQLAERFVVAEAAVAG
ncbi:flagellar biosynthesis protein FlhG [Noviherbaspirillum agri]